MDFSSIEWVNTELLTDDPDGKRHVLDLIAKIRVRVPVDGSHTEEMQPWLIVIHIEIESPDRTTRLKPRLPYYYHHLREKYHLPVLPVVIYLKVGLDGIGIDTVTERFWELDVFTFKYLYVGLPALDGLEYVQQDNWLGVALSALMRIPPDRVAWLGAEALRRLTTAPLNDQQRFLLGECVQAYLPLNEEQQREYDQLLSTSSYSGVQAVNQTVYEKGMEKGMEKGRGQEAQILVERLLADRFGLVSEGIRRHLETLSINDLEELASQIWKVQSLEELSLPK